VILCVFVCVLGCLFNVVQYVCIIAKHIGFLLALLEFFDSSFLIVYCTYQTVFSYCIYMSEYEGVRDNYRSS